VLLREHGWMTRQVAGAVHRSAAEELLVLSSPRPKALAQQAVDGGWEHAEVRAAVRACFDSKRRAPAVRNLARQLRQGLQGMFAAELSDADRRELRTAIQRPGGPGARLGGAASDRVPAPAGIRSQRVSRL
jgi:hypothetical protein